MCSHIVLMIEQRSDGYCEMTEAEVADALMAAMQVNAPRVKAGRVTFYEAIHGTPMKMFAEKVAQNLCRYIVFVKTPLRASHSIPPRGDD